MKAEHRVLQVACALVAALALLAGCCSDSSTGPCDGDGAGYPDQSTPDGLLAKLEMAYEAMDVAAYMECLDEEFIFFANPYDLGVDPPPPEYWDKAEDRLMHERMFADSTVIESITLALTVVSTDSLPGEDPVDPSDDVWEYDVNVNLRVDCGLSYFANGRVVFMLRPPRGRDEAVWQIVEQYDFTNEPQWIEDMTWTGMKLGFSGMGHSLYPIRSSPENVLLKLELAYERMDAEAYLDCLAEDFFFYLNPEDVTSDPTLPEYWDKDEETTIHGNMFGEDTDVLGVLLWLTHDTEDHDPGDPEDPLDDLWTYREDYDIRVAIPPDLTLHAISPSDFVFQVDPDDVGHGGMLLWEIVLWYDLPYEWRADASAEEASWGRIKALWR